MYSYCMFMCDYPDWDFSVLFSQIKGKCQGKTRKDGNWPALFLIFVLFLCIFCVVCIVCFVTFCVLFVCKCVLYYCHRVATQLQLTNVYISYHIHKYRPVCVYNSYQHAATISRRSATDIWWLAVTDQTRFSAGTGVLLIDNTMSFKSIILRMSNIIDS
jgi:hypothetical protein